MTEARSECITGPIFVVGAPRSGTSILTWCLGQHPNIIPQEESGWIGPLAIDLAARYRTGTVHGERSQLSALGVDRDQFLEKFGETIDALIHAQRASQERICLASAKEKPSQVDPSFSLCRSRHHAKSRWVDGTPEYSTQICALKKLFPRAKFVHIVRDAHDVVQSMLHFKLCNNVNLASTDEEAYAYWYKMVRACLNAEAALGSDHVHRLRYKDLVEQPESTMARILGFLGEPLDHACVEPLTRRINSSCVPPQCNYSNPKPCSPAIETALKLNERLQSNADALALAPYSAAELESEFEERVQYVAQGQEEDYQDQCAKTNLLSTRLNLVGVILLIYLLTALYEAIRHYRRANLEWTELVWLGTAMIGATFYLYLRRTGLKIAFRYALDKTQSMLGRQLTSTSTRSLPHA